MSHSNGPGRWSLDRRILLGGAAGFGALGLGGCANNFAPITLGAAPSASTFQPALLPIRAEMSRVFDVTVCLRPFRAAGPRLDAEMIGDTLVVHNYGHGGSGWSLSWGSGTIAVEKAMASGPKAIAVVGCGALGLTSAILAQEAGAKVTIYAKDLLPDARSSRATGSWTPDSRIALTDVAGPKFGELWEKMARTSFHRYRRYLGLPGEPVRWSDRYFLSDHERNADDPPSPEPLDFAEYEDRIRDLTPRSDLLPPGSTPFPTAFVRHRASMQFNVADYGHTLMMDFLAAGGRFERREFHSPGDLATLSEKVVINCPGYGARALMRDESIVPVRGQISWLIPQAEMNYGLAYKGVSVLSRTDGIVVQAVWGGDMFGYKDENETPDRAETEKSITILQELYARMRQPPKVV